MKHLGQSKSNQIKMFYNPFRFGVNIRFAICTLVLLDNENEYKSPFSFSNSDVLTVFAARQLTSYSFILQAASASSRAL